MNPEHEPVPKTRFETLNHNGKLVRDGIYEIMNIEGDNPELIPVEDEIHRRNVFRQKVLEEYEEFLLAKGKDQIDEAGDFLAAWDMLARETEVNEFFSKLAGSFQLLVHDRGINMNHAVIARQQRAAKHGEFDAINPKVVRAVEVSNPDRLGYYADNGQWREIKI